MNILITGSSGLLGSQIVKKLTKNKGCSVIACTTNVKKAEERFRGLNCEIVSGQDLAARDFQTVDLIINCAYPMNKKGAELADGLDFIIEIMKKAAGAPIKGFINISSQSVYGNGRTSIASEESPVAPEDLYALGKYMAEQIADACLKSVPHIHVRLASLLSPELKVRFVNRFVSDVICGKPISAALGEQHIQFLDVRDAVNAICEICLSWKYDFSGVLNVGGEDAYSIYEIAEMVNEVADELGIMTGPIRAADTIGNKNTRMNSKKMTRMFSWRPEHSMRGTIRTIFETELCSDKVGGGGRIYLCPHRFSLCSRRNVA